MIRAVTFLGGLYFFLEFLLPKEFFGFSFAPYHEFITNGFISVGVAALGLGIISIFRVHGVRTLKLTNGWIPSALLLISMLAMIFVTTNEALLNSADAKLTERAQLLREFAVIVQRDGAIANLSEGERTALAFKSVQEFDASLNQLPILKNLAFDDFQSARNQLGIALQQPPSRAALTPLADALTALISGLRAYQATLRESSLNRSAYNLLFQGLWTALATAMFSLLGFYIAAAAYRAFRVRSVESALMMVSAVIVMMGQIPFGVWLYEGFPALRSWLLSVPSAAAFRAIRIGAGVAGLLMALRMWLSLDRKGSR